MASAFIRFFMKDADAVKDADADQCKRTFSLPLLTNHSLSKIFFENLKNKMLSANITRVPFYKQIS